MLPNHNPLDFSMEIIKDAILVANEWIINSQLEDPLARYPLILWNCLPRAGASQFHGHLQVHFKKYITILRAQNIKNYRFMLLLKK